MTVESHVLFGAEPEPEPTMPQCIFCHESTPPKVFMEGGLVRDGEFVFRFRGVVHDDCAEAAMEEHR